MGISVEFLISPFFASEKFYYYEWLQNLIIIIKIKRDMITVCILAHGGPNKTIQLSDLRVFKLADLINVSYFYHLTFRNFYFMTMKN